MNVATLPDDLAEALADALGRVVADVKREWRGDVERLSAESRVIVAELRAEIVTLNAGLKDAADRQAARVADAIVALRVPQDGAPGMDADADLVAGIVAERLSVEIGDAIRSDVELIRADVAAIAGGVDEKIAAQVSLKIGELPDMVPLIAEMVAATVAALPPAAPGNDADPAVIAEMVADEVAKLPPAEPGKPVDPEDVRALVIAELDAAVKALPAPSNGHTPTTDELAALVDAAVSRACSVLPRSADVAEMIANEVMRTVAALPAPRDGVGVSGAVIDRNGTLILTLSDGSHRELGRVVGLSVDPATVEQVVTEAVAEAVAKLPRPESIDPAAVADMISGEVTKTVAALPVPNDGESVDMAEVERMVSEAVAKRPPPERGPEGPAGKFVAPKAWSRGVHYESALITHAGSTWCAMRDTAEEPPHEDWVLVASRGEDAPVGEVRGLHDETKQYRKFDLVAWNGSEWRAKHDDPGPLPGDGWAMSAKVGKPGRPGDPGLRGDPGIGKPGPPGAVIVRWVKDGYRATPIMSDGTAGPALDVHEFFELYHGEAG